jgi:hypothetical protein
MENAWPMTKQSGRAKGPRQAELDMIEGMYPSSSALARRARTLPNQGSAGASNHPAEVLERQGENVV